MIFNQLDDRRRHTMVLKEDVFLWFKHLDATSRLSVMHGLLNMCLPVELRFLGNCLEDLCKKDFLVMRERELKANNIGELQKLVDLNDDGVRTQLIVAVALLQTSNRPCATTIFNTLMSWALLLNQDGLSDRQITEILLLMNMALMHPAFTFEQKRTLEVQLKLVDEQYTGLHLNSLSTVDNDFANQYYQQPVDPSDLPQERELFHCNCTEAIGTLETNQTIVVGPQMANNVEISYPAATTCCTATNTDSSPPLKVNSSSTKSTTLSTGSPKAQIKVLELKHAQRKKKTHKKMEYRIQVTWSNGEVTEISKTHQELCNFHQQLISFQDELGHKERYIPYFTGPKLFGGNKVDDPTDEGMGKMADYLKQLMSKVPHHLLDSELVTKFFRGNSSSSSLSNASKLECENTDGVEQKGSQQPANAFSSSSSSLSSSSVSLPASPPPTANTTITSNNANCLVDNMIDNVGCKMKSLTIYNSHQNVEPLPANVMMNNSRSYPLTADACNRSYNEDKLLDQIFFKDRMTKDLEELRRRFDKKEMMSLTEADLIKEGFEPKKSKQIISRLETFKLQMQNGGLGYGMDNIGYQSPTATPNCDVTSPPPTQPPPPIVLQPNCNLVHPVQNTIYMPEAPIDYLVNYSIAPISSVYIDGERTGIQTPSDLSISSNSPSAERLMCNGAIDRVGSPHLIHGGAGYVQAPHKGFEVGGGNRIPTVNGGRPMNVHQKPSIKGRVNNRRESLTSSQKPNNGQESGKIVSSGELNEMLACLNASNVTSCEVDGNFSSTSSVFTQPDSSHSIGKVIPSFTATTSVTYSLSQQSQQQQVIGSHQQQAPLHVAGGMNTMGVNRLPARPTTLTTAMCPCSRASTAPPIPPTISPMNYAFMPLIGSVFTGFNPPGGQTSYITTHSTNGYVSAAHPSVQPPSFYTTLQSPECIPTEMTIPNRFPLQQTAGTVVTQPPPPGMVARTTGPHTSMPPPPSPLSGYIPGATPNVGFPGSQISVLPVATQLSLCGGMNQSIPTYVRLKPSCYNCGHCGHQGSECNEATMDETNRGSHFRLSYHPEDVNVDGCD